MDYGRILENLGKTTTCFREKFLSGFRFNFSDKFSLVHCSMFVLQTLYYFMVLWHIHLIRILFLTRRRLASQWNNCLLYSTQNIFFPFGIFYNECFAFNFLGVVKWLLLNFASANSSWITFSKRSLKRSPQRLTAMKTERFHEIKECFFVCTKKMFVFQFQFSLVRAQQIYVCFCGVRRSALQKVC